MTNFWAQRLGVQPAPQQVQPAAPVATPGAPWWAPAPVPQPVPMPQAPGIPGYPPVPMPQVPAPEPEHHGWGSVKGSLAKAKSAKLTSVCGNCGSGNVFRPTPNAMEQCYDCGENPRFSQTGGEGGLPSEASGPTQQARQISGGGGAGGRSNFNPGEIVARL
ncbi:hypothetical protein [Terracoccus sp. 273MFTsu3.1]|uniref:hypothetical protein n=1 Tax=Terracoccus sp. 273MFTsu3.1 TaxID=1172188 RepID=UPI00048B53F0|nr:hypothetical protein [Terracoccus sp. 273MFTsu3.1]